MRRGQLEGVAAALASCLGLPVRCPEGQLRISNTAAYCADGHCTCWCPHNAGPPHNQSARLVQLATSRPRHACTCTKEKFRTCREVGERPHHGCAPANAQDDVRGADLAALFRMPGRPQRRPPVWHDGALCCSLPSWCACLPKRTLSFILVSISAACLLKHFSLFVCKMIKKETTANA